MTKFTRWAIGDTIIFDYPQGMNQVTLTIIDESGKASSSGTLNEKQLIEMQSAIREILSDFSTDP